MKHLINYDTFLNEIKFSTIDKTAIQTTKNSGIFQGLYFEELNKTIKEKSYIDFVDIIYLFHYMDSKNNKQKK